MMVCGLNKLQLFLTSAINKGIYVPRGWVSGLLPEGLSLKAIIQTSTQGTFNPFIDGWQSEIIFLLSVFFLNI